MANVKLTKIAIKFGLQKLLMPSILLTSAHAIFVYNYAISLHDFVNYRQLS